MIVSDERVARFISEKLRTAFCPPFYAFGSERHGEIVNGVLINQFEGASCHVSAAGERWTSEMLRAIGCYVYGQLGCERMTLTTEQPDVAAYAERLGGKIEGVMRSHFGKGRDAIIIGILKEEWRY